MVQSSLRRLSPLRHCPSFFEAHPFSSWNDRSKLVTQSPSSASWGFAQDRELFGRALPNCWRLCIIPRQQQTLLIKRLTTSTNVLLIFPRTDRGASLLHTTSPHTAG